MSSLLYSPQFKSSEAELRRKHTEFLLDSSHGFRQQQQSQQQQQPSSGLMRYRSAPSSVLLDLVDNNGGAGCEDFRDFQYPRPSSPEVETVLARFFSSCNAPDSNNGLNNSAHQLFQERPVKQEAGDSVSKQNGYSNSPQMMYQTQQVHPLDNANASSYGAVKSTGFENSMQSKMGVGNRSNLVRQSSSPAGFLANLNVDNGFRLMKDASSFGVSNGTNGEASPSTARLNSQFSFSSASPQYSRESRHFPRIAETGNRNMGESGESNQILGNAINGVSSHYIPAYSNDTWDNSTFHDLKRGRDNDGNKFSSTTTPLDTQSANPGHRSHVLSQHLSLPTHFEMPGMEKILQFQDSIPCKIRAKRGFATHPRSIAERMRRTRISERMRKLQDLFPNMDKQTNTAEMLELAVESIKDLKKQVKALKDIKSKCSCSSKQKHS